LSSKFNKIKDLSSIGIADITGSIISALFWFYLATLMEPEEYGKIHYVISIASVAATISILGATQSLLVYSAKNVKIHSTLYSLNLIVGVVSATIVAFIVKDLSAGLLVIGYMVFAIAWSDVLGKKYFKMYTKYILVQKILMVSLSVGFFFILGKDGIILGMAISFFVGFLRVFRGFRETKIDFKLFKKKFSFISYNFILSLTSTLGSTDKLIIASLFGFGIVGNYALGMQFLSLLMVLPLIVGKYLIPQEASGEENKKLKKMIIFISIGIGGLGVLVGPEIASFLFPKYSELDSIIRIMSLGVIPATIALTYSAKFLANEKGNYSLFLGISKTLIMILLIIVLGHGYGIEGIAAGIVLSETCIAVFSAILSKKMKLSKV
jgi:O-antigen/teichoic acid export membrane protein